MGALKGACRLCVNIAVRAGGLVQEVIPVGLNPVAVFEVTYAANQP